MKIVVNWDRCDGNGICAQLAPEVFQLNDRDEMTVLIERPGPELLPRASEAVRRCPKLALKLVDE